MPFNAIFLFISKTNKQSNQEEVEHVNYRRWINVGDVVIINGGEVVTLISSHYLVGGNHV